MMSRSVAYEQLKKRLERGYVFPAHSIPQFMKPLQVRSLTTEDDAIRFLMERGGITRAKAKKKFAALKASRVDTMSNPDPGRLVPPHGSGP